MAEGIIVSEGARVFKKLSAQARAVFRFGEFSQGWEVAVGNSSRVTQLGYDHGVQEFVPVLKYNPASLITICDSDQPNDQNDLFLRVMELPPMIQLALAQVRE